MLNGPIRLLCSFRFMADTSSAYNVAIMESKIVRCTTASRSMAVCQEWSVAEPALLSWCVDDSIRVLSLGYTSVKLEQLASFRVC